MFIIREKTQHVSNGVLFFYCIPPFLLILKRGIYRTAFLLADLFKKLMMYLLFRKCYLKKMVLCFLLLVTYSQYINAQSYRNTTVSIKVKNESIKTILNNISKSANVKFFYSHQQIDSEKKMTINEKNIKLEKILRYIFPSREIEFKFEENRVILITRNESLKTNKIYLKGKVLDEQEVPMIGATIQIDGIENSVITDRNGEFTLLAQIGDKLKISFVGFKTEEKIITQKTTNIVVYLQENAMSIDNVLITGYQKLPRERATGSFTILSEKKLEKRIRMNILSSLEGMVTGLTTYNDKLEIRGQTTLLGNPEPLYVVDGFPFEGSLNSISPDEVENITVLKDAAAASIYGARSANGVIVITTKMGKDLRTSIDYSSSLSLNFLKDQRDYLNLMNSSELVDFQKDMFNAYHVSASALDSRLKLSEIENILYQHEAGKLTDTEMESQLDYYRNRDNKEEFNKLNFMKKNSISQQHNLSIRGGSSKYRYSINTNYRKTDPYDKKNIDDRIGYNAKGNYRFFDWLNASFAVLGSFTNSNNSGKGFSPTFLYTGTSTIPSYRTIWDNKGNEQRWDFIKSQSEIDRLTSIGLYDESEYPLRERNCYNDTEKSNYTNINLGVSAKIINGLTFDFKYQTEISNNKSSSYISKDASKVRQLVNSSSTYNELTGDIINNVPYGGLFNENRYEKSSYTLRAQLNYNKTYNKKHELTAILGAERRNILTTKTYTEKYGYDPISLTHKAIDEEKLNSTIYGTESLSGLFTLWTNGFPKAFSEILNRYISFYSNIGYTLNSKYDLSGSIRIDQSNLYGTNPKNQYRPLWSYGVGWQISKEKFMTNYKWVNHLSLKLTQGINGNIPKEGGPYMIAQSGGLNSWSGDYGSYITNPPNSSLRWERTIQTNIELNFGIFGNRLSGSVDLYNKRSSDLLGNRQFDSTQGWESLIINYAKMYNRGIEFSLNSSNIQTKYFSWDSSLIFSYNKNKITELDNEDTSVSSYINGTNSRSGLPNYTLYSIRWAGLDNSGHPQAYTKDGNIVGSIADLSASDLIECGTTIPPYYTSLSNDFSYKRFNISFIITMYLGNKMRDAVLPMITQPQSYLEKGNQNKDITHYWRGEADNNNDDIIPSIYRNASENITKIWTAADKHILNAGYINLRNITVSYTVPKNIINKWFMNNMTLKAQVENIGVWGFNGKGLNPKTWNGRSLQTSMGYDLNPTYSFGLYIKF